MKSAILIISSLQLTPAAAFIPSGLPIGRGQGTSLNFGLPSGFGSNKSDDKPEQKKEEKKISAGGLVQLITAGMGAPFLGDFEDVDKVSEVWHSLAHINCRLV
jgi:hypothetical protein